MKAKDLIEKLSQYPELEIVSMTMDAPVEGKATYSIGVNLKPTVFKRHGSSSRGTINEVDGEPVIALWNSSPRSEAVASDLRKRGYTEEKITERLELLGHV